MAVVVVVRLLRLDLAVAGSHHDVAIVQKHLTHSVLKEHTETTWLETTGQTAGALNRQETGSCSDLVVVEEHEPLLLLGPEAEAGVEVVPEVGNVGHVQVQVTLTGEMSLTSHLH